MNYFNKPQSSWRVFTIQLHKNHCDLSYDMFCLWWLL